MDNAVPGKDIPVLKETKLGSQKHRHGHVVLLNGLIMSTSQQNKGAMPCRQPHSFWSQFVLVLAQGSQFLLCSMAAPLSVSIQLPFLKDIATSKMIHLMGFSSLTPERAFPHSLFGFLLWLLSKDFTLLKNGDLFKTHMWPSWLLLR